MFPTNSYVQALTPKVVVFKCSSDLGSGNEGSASLLVLIIINPQY